MEFSSLQSSIQDAWNFTWPPIVQLLLMVLGFLYLAPTSTQKLRPSLLALMDPRRARILRATLRLWGLGKLLPILMAILILVILFIVERSARAIGFFLPPQVSVRSEVLPLRSTEPRLIACLADEAISESNPRLSSTLLRSVRRLGDLTKDDPNVQNWQQKIGRSYVAFGKVKFLLLWAVLCLSTELLVGRRLRLARGLTAVAVLVVAGVIVIAQHLYAWEQRSYGVSNAGESKLLPRQECRKVDLNDNQLQLMDKAAQNLRTQERWWSLEAGATKRQIQWFYRQVVRGDAQGLHWTAGAAGEPRNVGRP